MKFISWNVNGLRACIQKGFLEQFNKLDADFFCLQETKLSEGQLELELPGYEQYWCHAGKKGYSGTAIFTKHTPLSVHYGLDVPELDKEGRLITLEYPEFYLVNCYTPNAQRGLARIDHRLTWDDAFRAYLQKLDAIKPVILCGDLNVAHQEIDLKNPKSNRGNAGFSDEERESFQKTLDLGFTDTFRHLHPDATGCYSWWSYMFHARENNAGWRIDYFLVSDRIRSDVYKADICSEILGSDHCPVAMDISLICNGGIWSPMSEGTAKKVYPPEKEPKASAFDAKALVAFAAVAALLLAAVLLLPGLFQPAADDNPSLPDPFPLYTVSAFDTPLVPSINLDISSSIMQPVTNSTPANTFIDSVTLESYCTDDVLFGDVIDSNAWLRIELTEGGRWYTNTTNLQDTDFWETIAAEYPCLRSALAIVPYYQSSDKTQHLGWLVLLTTTGCFNVTSHYTPPLEYEYINSDSLSVSTAIHMDDSLVYIQYGEAGLTVSDARCWLTVEMTPEAQALYPIESCTLTAIPLDIGTTLSSNVNFWIVRECYADPQCTQQLGWLIYSDLDITQLEIILNCNTLSDLEYSEIVPVVPYVTAIQAAQITTSKLVKHIISNPGIAEALYTPPISTSSFIAYSDNLPAAMEQFPALAELAGRDDAATCLMYAESPEDPNLLYLPYELLSADIFRAKMTPYEEACFLVNLYTSSPWEFSYSGNYLNNPDSNVGSLSTASLILLLDDQFCNYMNACSTSEARLYVYMFLRGHNNMLQELETREDAMSVMQSLAPAVPANYLLEIWPDVMDWLNSFIYITVPA